MKFVETGQQQVPLPGVDVDKTNSGEKCEQVREVGVVDRLSPVDILYAQFFSIFVPKVVMDPLNQLLSMGIECLGN